MGTGYHGGFGNTAGSKAVRMSPAYTGDDKDLKTASQWIKPQSGYTDIVIHGSPDNVAIKKEANGFTLITAHLQECLKVIKNIPKNRYV